MQFALDLFLVLFSDFSIVGQVQPCTVNLLIKLFESLVLGIFPELLLSAKLKVYVIIDIL
jgi:hypothetical protein